MTHDKVDKMFELAVFSMLWKFGFRRASRLVLHDPEKIGGVLESIRDNMYLSPTKKKVLDLAISYRRGINAKKDA